jgi:hypothetical protein
MIGTKFKAQSGTDYEWFVFKSHGLFSDTWYCYPIARYQKDQMIKDNFIQCFSTDFIKQNEIYDV